MKYTWCYLAVLLAFSCGDRVATNEEGVGREHGSEHRDEGEEEHEEEKGVVTLSPAAISRAGISLEEVTSHQLVGGVEVPAEVTLDSSRAAHVTPLLGGPLAAVHVRLGDKVSAGQVLATLRSEALGEARATVSETDALFTVAESNFARQEELQKAGIGSRRDFLEAEGALKSAQAARYAARSRLSVYSGGKKGGGAGSLVSSLSGVVIESHAVVGEVVEPTRDVFVIADLSRVFVIGHLYEQDVTAARVGAPAIVTLQAYPGRVWHGTISYTASVLDEETRTLIVRVELDNLDGMLRPGLSGLISLSPPGVVTDKVLAVPEGAVQRLSAGEVVFVPADEENEYRAIPIETGARVRGLVEIRSGLKAGDRIVTEGAFTLKSQLLKSELGEGHSH